MFTITAALPGFSSFERTDFAIGVGRTLDIDIVMTVGGIEETITVSGESPLVDLTSAEVGGTVAAGELVEIPTVNRSYFSAVAMLPGIQFDQSSSLGNDSIIANGQNDDGNSVGFDGATNNDDASGTSAGGQVRVPIESVSEFQVLTNKEEFGGVIGGPIIRDKMHFFFSIERQLVNPSRSREYETRPDVSFTLSEQWKALNTLMRLDHQINANNSGDVQPPPSGSTPSASWANRTWMMCIRSIASARRITKRSISSWRNPTPTGGVAA